MNFRTTILLLVVLIAAAGVYFFASSNNPQDQVKTEESDQAGTKIFEAITPSSVKQVTLTPSSGERLAFERVGTGDEWRMTEPVKGLAEAFQVDRLLDQITELRSRGRVSAADKGLDKPRYVIELIGKDNKTAKLNVGSRSPVGDMLYVRLDGQDEANVVSSMVVEVLDKPASEYRKKTLLNVPTDKVTGVTVMRDGKTLRLEKSTATAGTENWQIVEPVTMPGETSQVTSLISAINSLRAASFVDETASSAGIYGLLKPTMMVTLSTAPPSTRPATTNTASTRPAAGEQTVVKFGRHDVEKKNVYAIASDGGPIVTVEATSLDALKKTPLDLRNREVLNVDANAVSRLSISTEKPATTQPTTQPAKTVQVVLERRSETATPPATNPATAPATSKPSTNPTTAPTTMPVAPQTKWLLASDPKGDADDTKVQALLAALHPLNAEAFLETFPTTQTAPAGTYVLKISTRSWGDEPAREYELKITDPGGEKKLVGELADLTFELDRALLEKLSTEFTAPKLEPAGPVFPGPVGPAAPTLPTIPPIQ
jgi:hypothetical protein